ncbi:MAG: glycosyltransferase [Clostridia bacterium]|nr:glycosyltransferase [Clostridia bacterium]
MLINNKEKNFISAVIYVHNNENEIEESLNLISQFLYNNFENYELICVNDYSTDNSLEIIKTVGKKLNNCIINIVNMSYYQGLEKSMLAGVDLSIGDFVYEFDTAIIDYDINELMNVYRKCLTGYDIISASPNKRMRKSSRLFYSIFNKNASMMNLRTETFRILSRRAINRINMIFDNIVYRKAIYHNCGLKVETITYNCTKNTEKLPDELKYRRKVALDSIIYFTNLGFKISFLFATAMMIFSILGLIYALLVFLLLKNTVEGWTTLMIFLSFGFFGVFTLLAILIKYVSLILETTHRKQKYIIEGITKINKN